MSKIKELNKDLKISNEELFVLHDVKIDNLENTFKVLERNNIFEIVIGNNIVSEERFQYLDDAIEYIKKKPYDLIVSLIGIMVEGMNKINNNKK